MLARAEFRDSTMDSHASSDIFLGKRNLLHEKTQIYTDFFLIRKYLSFTGCQYYQRAEDKSKIRPQNQKLDCIYLFSNLFGTQLIFKLFHFLNEFSFMTLKNTSRGKKRAYSSYYLLVSMLKHYKEEQKAMNS